MSDSDFTYPLPPHDPVIRPREPDRAGPAPQLVPPSTDLLVRIRALEAAVQDLQAQIALLSGLLARRS